MRKILFAALLLFSASAHAQFYLKAGVGQALSTAGQTVNSNGNALNGTVSFNSTTGKLSAYDVKAASLGVGIYAHLGAGIELSKNVAVELNAMIGMSMKKYTGVTAYPDNGFYYSEQDKMYTNHPVFINPSLVIQTGNAFNLYARGGLLLPLNVKMKEDFDGTLAKGLGTGTYARSQDYKTSFSLGFSGAMGCSFEIMKHVDIWGEVSLNSLSLYVKERILTAYSENGQDELNAVTNKDITYDKKGTGTGTNYPTYSVPLSNLGFNAGIRYRF